MRKKKLLMNLFIIAVPVMLLLQFCENNQAKIYLMENRDSIKTEMQQLLNDEFKLWYPLSLDTIYGGYFSDINYQWKLDGPQNKMIVTQARHVWSSANAALFYNNKDFLDIAEHGYKFLEGVMWDKEFGGFYDLVNRQGVPIKENGNIIKRAYGNSFAIYGLAAYYKASGNLSALELAKKTFYWLEEKSHDPIYGGYFQFLSRDGIPYKEGYGRTPPKDQNSSIHLLEAFTELYSVWKDKKLRERLNELLLIIRDKITTEKGYMKLFFTKEWQPISYVDSSENIRNENYEFDHVSFGHDVETAYLMVEASEALEIKDDTVTLKVAKKMVDHALRNGWDKKSGGLFDGGYYFNNDTEAAIIKDTKEWWSQAEALNTFLLMSELFPDDKNEYYDKFVTQWNYIKEYLIDKKYGGWYWGGIDKEPNQKSAHKSTIWKGNYHTSRSLINCIRKISYNSIEKTSAQQKEKQE